MLERLRQFDGADQIGLFDDGPQTLLQRLITKVAALFR
jgi:hypothetical protein